VTKIVYVMSGLNIDYISKNNWNVYNISKPSICQQEVAFHMAKSRTKMATTTVDNNGNAAKIGNCRHAEFET